MIMPWSAVAIIGASLIGGAMASDSSEDASEAQSASAAAGVAEQRRQFNAIQELLNPYVEAGSGAIGQQQAILGLSGQDAQKQAISGFESSPLFQSMAQQGENSILQNASATGGLRGGNVQGALSQFRPQLLNSLIEQQYNRLSGLSSLGQNAAAGVGNAGISTGQGISSLLQQQGAAQAGNALAQGRAGQQMLGGIQSGIGTYIGSGGTFGFGGGGGGMEGTYSAGGYTGTAGTGF